jgi:NADPH:quinone reductase-like Zn-dependent oxidoreductase
MDMKAVYIREFGGPENLEIRDVEMPGEPAGTQVLVRVHAAGLNRADLLQRRGHYPPPPGYSPNIPGLEFAGEVVKTGEVASSFGTGDRVFAITAGEAQAEFLVIDESLLVRIPDNLTFAEAAAVPEAFITAHDAIFTLGGLQPEETLVIHAVGSGWDSPRFKWPVRKEPMSYEHPERRKSSKDLKNSACRGRY